MSIGETDAPLCEIHRVGRQTQEWITGAMLCPALAAQGITLLGTSQAGPEFSFVRLSPRWSQLLLCISGGGWVWLEGGWQRCGAGQGYLTPAGTLHAYHADATEAWNLCWLQSSQEWLQLGDAPRLLCADPMPLVDALAGLRRELSEADTMLLSAWAQIIKTSAMRLIRPPTQADSRLRRLWGCVASDLTREWTVTMLAQESRLGEEHLRRLCRRDYGQTPMRQVAVLRMHQATALLASERLTIEAIAARVGYDNPFAFSTAFKRHLGVSPSEYRHGREKEAGR